MSTTLWVSLMGAEPAIGPAGPPPGGIPGPKVAAAVSSRVSLSDGLTGADPHHGTAEALKVRLRGLHGL